MNLGVWRGTKSILHLIFEIDEVFQGLPKASKLNQNILLKLQGLVNPPRQLRAKQSAPTTAINRSDCSAIRV
jgi:hypothetical protein